MYKYMDLFLFIVFFWDWYKTKVVHSVFLVFLVHVLQIPHMVWAGDVYLKTGYISYFNPALDFILYGIDLLEIPSIINVTLLLIYHLKSKRL